MRELGVMEVGGFRLGHAQDEAGMTGCTVILCDGIRPCGVDVRGGGPASRESQILNPLMAAEGVNAVLLSGGSAFGLDAAGGVQRYLEERGEGFATAYGVVPLVSQSCLFDLGVGSAAARPDAAMAYRACENAAVTPPAEGCVGAGTGCSVGKLYGMARAMKSGFGTYAIEVGGVRVGALVAVNALGDVVTPDGRAVAGLRTPDGRALCGTTAALLGGAEDPSFTTGQNTTLGVIVTNAAFSKAALTKIAGMAHNGYARAIRPVHTSMDGDTIYALSLGDAAASADLVGVMAAYAMERAIVRAVQTAKGTPALPAAGEL